MIKWDIQVFSESGRSRLWTVRATTKEDAQQLAFALDGGWGKEKDASEMLALAQMHVAFIKAIKDKEGK